MQRRIKKDNNNLNWESQIIHKILRNVTVDVQRMTISTQAMRVVVSFARDLTLKIVHRAKELMIISKKRTLQLKTMVSASKIELSGCGELQKQGIQFGMNAVESFQTSKDAHKDRSMIPIPRLRASVKQTALFYAIGKTSIVFLGGLLDYLLAELLESSSKLANELKQLRISPRHINLSVGNDKDFLYLFREKTIAQGGVLPSCNVSKQFAPQASPFESSHDSQNF
ncbi:histone H2B domain-containing protein [Heterostelium album PN500]|uniref:Histone H2B domain-containing protein n=1 Tax=Heterostelium pallidum (strain ATCC 26659 / Pp 5 / PN500) TaxID=670386 RepID=D3BIK7_HETP5|nr:histone H2B domain-containing protein [Heterostelium album PN500]EFA78631.1 histone H2B domain-containing protein [Heterostelium album PN500]|eukprot:XP_020430755.1 histone H2B domain-containing protein [Heterostelium album PN500]